MDTAGSRSEEYRMLLAVDIGNTNVVMAIHDANRWVTNWRIHTDEKKTSDEYFVIVESMLKQNGMIPSSIDHSIICSVVPNLTRTFEKVVASVTDTKPVMVSHETGIGLVRNSIPPEMGYDLVANMVAAHAGFPSETVMVIDFGTALTFTTVNGEGEVLGAAIAPGLITAVNSLFNNTAQIPQVQLKVPSSVIGRDSDTAIRSGIMIGFAGLVDSMVRKTEEELGCNLKIIITGGLSQTIAPLLSRVDSIEPFHTLEGLKLIHQGIMRNQG